MSEDLGGIEWDRIRLTWTAPSNMWVDSYTVKYNTTGAITEDNWDSSTTATTAFASIKGPGTTQNCTVKNLTELQDYYFAVKSTNSSFNSSVSNSPNATARQPDLDVGEWWLYKEYYDTNGEGNPQRSDQSYILYNVVAEDQTTYIEYDRGDDGTGDNVYNTTVVNSWTDERRVESDANAWGRTRVVYAPVVSNAQNVMHHWKFWVSNDDFTQASRVNNFPEAYATMGGLGDLDLPSFQYLYTGNHTAGQYYPWNLSSANGYPYSNGEVFYWYRFIHANPNASESGTSSHRHWYCDFTWNGTTWIASYDVGNASSHPEARGVGTYGVYNITQYQTWVGAGEAFGPSLDTVPINWWYSPEVHNYARKVDWINYRGFEDSAIFAYENRDFARSNFSVTDTNGSTDCYITITNLLDETCNFNILCMLIDKDATTPTWGNPYTWMVDGNISYPQLGAINANLSWTDGQNYNSSTLQGAIRKTGDLAPGASANLSWMDMATTDASGWYVWCAGERYDW
jgi:hypothetical protein